MNIEEVASIFHLPNVSVETPRISWTGSTKGAPPENLPIVEDDVVETNDIAPFAETNFRHRKYKFGIKTDDRRRHMYIIGKTGVGKTNMMNNMIISDIKAGHGIAVVDPHGELVSTILEHIPPERYDDVVLFDPADTEYPIAFNPLETVDSDQKQLIASGLISIFNKIWKESWGPRLEYILRNTILSLLDYPDSTLLGIPRILVDKQYRQAVVEKIQDPVIYDFWTKEFEQYNERTRSDAILPIQNKVGQFLSSPTIRNIVGQPKSSIDIREVMDKKKILLIRLSQGQIGEDNTALLGAMMITKMQLAAMSRVDVPEEERQDFFLYVDEFQNFATDSFAKILSEARKYRLNLTVANQYISQLSETVRDAIFGNVGSVVLFRVGAADSKFLAKEFEPVFEENDLVNLDKYHVYIKLAIDGVTGNAFSARTLKMPDKKVGDKDKIIALNREKFSVRKEDIEQSISKWSKEQMESVASQSSSN
ncbi:type IV secretory system conjugative DNA transfer family protein [bacterium]|nr:type IV secretory system conjugative DNA transfer family protein [bacterium]